MLISQIKKVRPSVSSMRKVFGWRITLLMNEPIYRRSPYHHVVGKMSKSTMQSPRTFSPARCPNPTIHPQTVMYPAMHAKPFVE